MSHEKNNHLFLTVMAGGNGTRFWPKSTIKKPKQFLAFGKNSVNLLGQTLSRFENLVPEDRRYILTTESLRDAVIREGLPAHILAEPESRNTAPCIYWAARMIADKDPDAVMLVMPSDHHIGNENAFLRVLGEAVTWAEESDDLVTLGVCPARPETGYGYLKLGKNLGHRDRISISQIDAFIEKPSLIRAQEFVHSKIYLWNAGMFVWRVKVVLEAFDRFMPGMREAWDVSLGRVEEAFPLMQATSIDYGIMEKAKNIVAFPLDCGWDDLGSWTSLAHLADEYSIRNGNNILNQGELLEVDAHRNIIDAPRKQVCLLGVEDLIIVEQGEILLIAHRDRAQDIRGLVEEFKKKRPELV